MGGSLPLDPLLAEQQTTSPSDRHASPPGGLLTACVLMATAELAGDGVPRDVERGVADLRSACEQGEVHACAWLDSMAPEDLPVRAERTPPPNPTPDAAPPWERIAKNIGQ